MIINELLKLLKDDVDITSNEFKSWFNGSKIVDDSGQPLIVYHGTNNKFDKFQLDRIGSNSGNFGHFGQGIYFSYEYNEAKTYGKNIIRAYLKIKNPFTSDDIEQFADKYGFQKSNVYIDKNWLLQKLKDFNYNAYKLAFNILKFGYELGWEKTFEELGRFTDKSPTNDFDWNYINDWTEYTNENSTSEVPEYITQEIESVLKATPKYGTGYKTGDEPNLLYLTDYGRSSDSITNDIKQAGYDGIIAGTEIVVFNPSQIWMI